MAARSGAIGNMWGEAHLPRAASIASAKSLLFWNATCHSFSDSLLQPCVRVCEDATPPLTRSPDGPAGPHRCCCQWLAPQGDFQESPRHSSLLCLHVRARHWAGHAHAGVCLLLRKTRRQWRRRRSCQSTPCSARSARLISTGSHSRSCAATDWCVAPVRECVDKRSTDRHQWLL